MSKKFFHIDSDKIYLTKKTDESGSYYISKVTLTNLTDKYLLFKVFLTKQKVYSLNPSTSFIPPREKVQVYIKRAEAQEEVSKADIFKFAAYPVDQTITDVFF
jgi:hypothetical protein